MFKFRYIQCLKPLNRIFIFSGFKIHTQFQMLGMLILFFFVFFSTVLRQKPRVELKLERFEGNIFCLHFSAQ